MFRKMMAVASLAAVAAASSLVAPTAASAKTSAGQFAAEQCGNGYWAVLEYPSYDECYAFAVQYYIQQTRGGGGSGGGGMTSPGDIPGYVPGQGCGATRIPCNPAN
ncbi:hypothetical protein [Brevundimonas diminuta]|uniref:hypothetical protein n=1 Tax=Brevundimonas diminuta TaxID=293 RepID=UPI001177543E|nr:hypothetical protein [Brevundimonas diminuta]